MNELAFGLEVTIVGFLVVIITLLLLCLVLVIFNKFLAYEEKNISEKKAKTATSSETAASGNKTAQLEQKKGSEQDATVPPEVVAASMGALLFTMETEGKRQYTIKSVHPIGAQKSKWSDIARKSTLEQRKDFVTLRRRRNLR